MKITYKSFNFRKDTLSIIKAADQIISEYENQGIQLTLRSIYYQFVSRGHLENTEKNYKKLGNILNDARMAGMISWTAIEDRTRFVRQLPHWSSPKEIIESASNQYRRDKWEGQPKRVEVFIEKDALIGVIEGVCNELDVPYFSCRGYVSVSEMWRAMRRIENRDVPTIILHLGDHDPSGIDMTRDIRDRLSEFGCNPTVERIALTMDQINEQNPPPNPAKQTDARFKNYSDLYGDESWELDALEPSYLSNLVRQHITSHRDPQIWNAQIAREESERDILANIVANIDTDE